MKLTNLCEVTGGRNVAELLSANEIDIEQTRSFDVSAREITSLYGCPKHITSNFYCSCNYLTSLQFGPTQIDGVFFCDGNDLSSLEYAPRKIGTGKKTWIQNATTASFSDNRRITSFIGIDEIFDSIYGNISMDNLSIAEGGLGWMLVEGVRNLFPGKNTSYRIPMLIINDSINLNLTVYDCQRELIEKGYEEFAQL